MSTIFPANLFFETGDEGDVVILEYYSPLKQPKRMVFSREKWEKMTEADKGEIAADETMKLPSSKEAGHT